MQMTTRLYKLKDTLENVNAASAWSRGRFTCISCRKSLSGNTFKTDIGNLCVDCIETELKKQARKLNLSTWTVTQFSEALEASGNIMSRLTVLWRFHEVLKFVTIKQALNLEALKKLLIRNLGFVQDHPLAQPVRQAAFEACNALGESLAPLLIRMCEPTPWQFYANIVMILGNIAPNHPEAAVLIKQAAKDKNPEIRKRAQAALLKQKATKTTKPTSRKSPKQERLQAAVSQLEPALRDLVQIGTEPSSAIPQTAQQVELVSSVERTMEALVDQHYTGEALKRIYKNHLHDYLFTAENFQVKGNFTIGKLKKSDTARALAKVYGNKELFQAFFDRLPQGVQDILESLVWEGGEREAKQLEKLFHVEIVKTARKGGYGNTQDIHDPYVIFQVRSQYDWRSYRDYSYSFYLSVADRFRKTFKEYLSAPDGYDIAALDRIKKTALLYEDQDRILRHVKLYVTYIEQGNLKFSKSTGKLLKSSLTQMAKYCSIKEFYDKSRKDLEYIKTRLIIDFLQGVQVEMAQVPAELIKTIFQNFFKTTTANPKSKQKKLYAFLYHLKGSYYEYNYEKREKRVKRSLQQLLKALPVSQWVSFENIEKYCFYREIYFNVVERKNYGNDLYFNKKYRGSFSGGYERVYIREGQYKDAVIVPFLKTMMFLFATFGILDVAYDVPENPLLQERDNPYLSLFDGVHYVRLTPLGAYILGLKKKYDAVVQEEIANVLLDDKRLIMTMEGRDPLKAMVIEKLADQISENCYKVNYQSFLKECSTKKDIKQKITMFKDHVSEKPPPIWQEFLDDVESKINPLVSKQKMKVFKLKQSQDLIALMARDDVLKQYIRKAEEYHIVIEESNISKVKKRLEEFGYFIDNI